MSNRTSLHTLACKDENAERISTITPDSNRSNFARDRDRILYSRCFRRLAHKTQVYLTSEGKEHARMRLTHTLEVTQVARSIARTLHLNEDLTEAIGLGHDVGHAPFGHAGEQQIHRYLQNEHEPPRHMLARLHGSARTRIPKGDFKHNFQSVRLLSALERYDSDRGLNLTIECLDGILKHTKISIGRGPSRIYEYPDPQRIFHKLLRPRYHRTLESQVVAIADELTQVAHDLADALQYRQVDPGDVANQQSINRILARTPKGQKLKEYFKTMPTSYPTLASHLASVIITYFVDETLRVARKQLSTHRNPRTRPKLWPNHVPDPASEFQELKDYKDRLVVNCHSVNRMDNKGMYVLRQLLDAYVSDPRQLPDAAFNRYKSAVDHSEWRKKWQSTDRLIRQPQYRLTMDELVTVHRAVESHDGGSLRNLAGTILKKIPYYFLFDAQWRRTIADQVAMMTDSNAEREFQLLYGTSSNG